MIETIEKLLGANADSLLNFKNPKLAKGRLHLSGPDFADRIWSASDRNNLVEVAEAFAQAHEMGLATVLWCYLRNSGFKTKEKDCHVAAGLTGQANHLGVTLQADIIKQNKEITVA